MKWQPDPDPHGEWFITAVEAFLDGWQGSLDEALGLRLGPGQRRPSTLARLAARDALYRRAAREFFPDLKPARQAHEIHRAFHQYETTGWRRGEWKKAACPREPGTLEALAWESLHRENPVLSTERIRKILVAS